MANDEKQSSGKKTKLPKPSINPEPVEDELEGTIFAGRYEIEKRIGQGGMGLVYLARHKNLGRKVVIKTLINTVTGEGKQRFEREARQLSSLAHSNIVTLYDFGYEGRTAYIVMEYIDGKTLKHSIRKDRRMGRQEFFNIAIQIADAVSEAHSRGIIHRDLKPANIMLTKQADAQSLVKVLDFGLAKLSSSDTELTKDGNLVGSVSYVSPEQILGKGSDTRGDVYSLGVVFYYILAGEKPFAGSDEMAVLYQHVHNEPPALGERLDPSQGIPESTVELIHNCLSKNPDDRPRNAGVLLERLLDEISLSSLHLPISSRDLTRLSDFQAPDAQDDSRIDLSRDSGLLTDEDQYTPTHLPSSGTHASGSLRSYGEAGDSSSLSHSQIMENSALLQVQMKRTRWLISLVVVLLIGSGVTVWVLNDEAQEDPVKEAQLQLERLEMRLDDVATNLDEQKFGPAELILDGLKAELVDHPELLDRASSYRDQITVGRLVREGRRYKTNEQWEQALQVYEKVLNVQPSHEDAQAEIELISTELDYVEPVSFGSLEIRSSPQAEVFIEDVLVGSTPFTQKLPEGTHRVELRARGYETWSESVMISEDSLLELEPLLEEAEAAPSARSQPRPARVRRAKPSSSASQGKTNDDNDKQEPAPSRSGSRSVKRTPSPPKPKSNSGDSLFEPRGENREAKTQPSDDMFSPSKDSKSERKFDLLEVEEDGEEQGGTGADFLD